MTSRKLFLKRLIDEWKFQWGVIHSVLDWSIMLYFLIPSIVILYLVYREMWRNPESYWHSNIPFAFLVTIIVFISSRGNFRTYQKEADLLHIIQLRKMICGLKLYSLFSSAMLLIVELLLIFIMSLPILIIQYGRSPFEIVFLFLSITAYRMIVLTIKKVNNRAFIKWILVFITFFVTVLLLIKVNVLITGILGVFLDLFIIWLYCSRLLVSNQLFLKEIEIEENERLKYIKIILNISMEVEKENRHLGKMPFFILRNSKRLFKNRNPLNGLT